MSFNGQEPYEFVSEMPDGYDDEDEYYGEEEEGYAEDDGMDDYEEDDEEAAPAARKGGGGKRDWVKTALMGIAALLFLGAGGYYAAMTFAPEVVNDLVNNLPFVSKAPDDQFAEKPPEGGEKPPEGDVAPAPKDPVKPPDGDKPPPKPGMKPEGGEKTPPKPDAGNPKPVAVPSTPEFTEGVPPQTATKPSPKPKWVKPKWKKPASLAWQKPGTASATMAAAAQAKKPMTAWQAKVARQKWLAKKHRWAKAGYKSRWAAQPTRWSAGKASRWQQARWRARAGYRTYRSRYGRTSYAAYPRSWNGGWHVRYGTPAYSAGSRWLPGPAYIPWGGGSGTWHRAYTGAPASVWHPTAWHPGAVGHWTAGAPSYAPRARARYTTGRYGVQVGSFSDNGNAAALVSQLRAQGMPAYMGRRGGVARVYIGSYGNRAAANQRMNQLRTQGIPAAVTPH